MLNTIKTITKKSNSTSEVIKYPLGGVWEMTFILTYQKFSKDSTQILNVCECEGWTRWKKHDWATTNITVSKQIYITILKLKIPYII